MEDFRQLRIDEQITLLKASTSQVCCHVIFSMDKWNWKKKINKKKIYWQHAAAFPKYSPLYIFKIGWEIKKIWPKEVCEMWCFLRLKNSQTVLLSQPTPRHPKSGLFQWPTFADHDFSKHNCIGSSLRLKFFCCFSLRSSPFKLWNILETI